MKICLINSNFTEQIIPNFMINFESGLLSLGAILERKNYEVKIINLFQLIKDKKLVSNKSFCRNAARLITRQGIDILGFNTRCDTYPIVLDIARRCKQFNPGSIIILGGPQATFTDIETLKNFSFVDIIVRGEGELTLLDLMNSLQEKTDLKNIAGITYRENGNIIQNRSRDLIGNLDSLPLPAYSLIKEYLPTPKELKYGWAYISIGRGCPYSCTFCSTSRMWQRCYRLRSPGNILEEIIFLKRRYNINRFYLGHDNFLTNKEDVKRISSLLLQKKINIKWTCSSRIDSVDTELLEMISRSGCERIFFGVESGSLKIQRYIQKNIKPSAVSEVIEECRKFNIFVILSFIIGFPEETEEDINATLELALRSRISKNCYPYIRILTPIAGTELFAKNINRLCLRDSWAHLYLIGDLIKKSKWSKGLIKKYPAIFSSFYCIRVKYIPQDLPYEAVTVFSTLVSAYPLSSYIAMQELNLKPLKLLRELKSWARNEGLIRNEKAVTMFRHLSLRHFPDFIENIYKQKDIPFNLIRNILNLEKTNCRNIYIKVKN